MDFVLRFSSSIALVLLVLLGACSSKPPLPPPPPWSVVPEGGAPPADAPITERPSFTELFAVSDLHGHPDQLRLLLERSALVAPNTRPISWTGGSATLVLVGDFIDKGPSSLGVIQEVMELEAAANAKGGTVIALWGNHEAEFLADPTDSKFTGSDGFSSELGGNDGAVQFSLGTDPRAIWLRSRPVAAKVGSYFFSHAGDAHGATIEALRGEILAAFQHGDSYRDARIIGGGSPLESRAWYSPPVVDRNNLALGVSHVVFGHDPNAFEQGKIVAPAEYKGALVKIDAGIGAGYSDGEILHVRKDGASEIAEAIGPKGDARPLYKVP